MFVALPLSLSLSPLLLLSGPLFTRHLFLLFVLPSLALFLSPPVAAQSESAALESGGSAWSLTRLFAVCDFHDGFDSRFSEVG